MFLLKKFLLVQKNSENCHFLSTIFLSHENLVQKILFVVKPASYLFGGLNYITWAGKMHKNLPYPNIFTRKKIIHFLVFENFISKNQFFNIFLSFSFKKTSKKSFLLLETSVETWFKCQVTGRKKCMFVRFSSKNLWSDIFAW